MIITNSRYALVGYFITSYPTWAHGIICLIALKIVCLMSSGMFSIHKEWLQIPEAGLKQNKSI